MVIPRPPLPLSRESNGVIRENHQGSSNSKVNNITSASYTSLLNSLKHKDNSGGSSSNFKSGASSSSNSHAKVTISSDFIKSGPSGSKNKGGGNPREIKFNVRHNTTGETFTVSLAECETIDTLKTLIHAQ
jgi:hypothetical protein